MTVKYQMRRSKTIEEVYLTTTDIALAYRQNNTHIKQSAFTSVILKNGDANV